MKKHKYTVNEYINIYNDLSLLDVINYFAKPIEIDGDLITYKCPKCGEPSLAVHKGHTVYKCIRCGIVGEKYTASEIFDKTNNYPETRYNIIKIYNKIHNINDIEIMRVGLEEYSHFEAQLGYVIGLINQYDMQRATEMDTIVGKVSYDIKEGLFDFANLGQNIANGYEYIGECTFNCYCLFLDKIDNSKKKDKESIIKLFNKVKEKYIKKQNQNNSTK